MTKEKRPTWIVWVEVSKEEWDNLSENQREIMYNDRGEVRFVKRKKQVKS